MIYTTVSTGNIIAKTARTLKREPSQFATDAIEFIDEALQDIGASMALKPTYDLLFAKNHRASFPCDLVYIDSVYHNGVRLPYSGGPVPYNCDDHVINAKQNPDLEFYQTYPDTLITSFSEGEVVLNYFTSLVDDEGYPLIPDDHDFKEACFYRILSRGYLQDGDIKGFQFFNEYYEDHKRKARNRAKFPSPDRMETLRRFWTDPAPNYDRWEEGFRGIENKVYYIETGSGGGQYLDDYKPENKLD